MKGIEELTEDERRALRGSKFAPLSSQPPLPSSRIQSRMAHPGGPVATNKAAALAKFLERKLQEPGGLESLNPRLVELAVKNAKETVNAGGAYDGRIRHVSSFDDNDEDNSSKESLKPELKKSMKKKKKKNALVGSMHRDDKDTSSEDSLKPKPKILKKEKQEKKKKKKKQKKNKKGKKKTDGGGD